jgi:hypothetical protein
LHPLKKPLFASERAHRTETGLAGIAVVAGMSAARILTLAAAHTQRQLLAVDHFSQHFALMKTELGSGRITTIQKVGKGFAEPFALKAQALCLAPWVFAAAALLPLFLCRFRCFLFLACDRNLSDRSPPNPRLTKETVKIDI